MTPLAIGLHGPRRRQYRPGHTRVASATRADKTDIATREFGARPRAHSARPSGAESTHRIEAEWRHRADRQCGLRAVPEMTVASAA